MTSRAKSIVPKIGEPDIDESYIRQRDAVLLETLLIDRMRKDYKAKISSRGILGCDVPCESMSEAAIFVRGTQTNGKKFWQKMCERRDRHE